jgi:hypothetical protein
LSVGTIHKLGIRLFAIQLNDAAADWKQRKTIVCVPEDERKWWVVQEAEMNDDMQMLNNSELMFVFLPPALTYSELRAGIFKR